MLLGINCLSQCLHFEIKYDILDRKCSPERFYTVTKIVRKVYGESSPTSWIPENDALFKTIPETRSLGITKRTALTQISNTSRQQISNNNSNSLNNSSQRLTADQLAMRTRLRRDYFLSFAARYL
ncbi:hypothetical protein AVEN_211089-1 [Araneus ventricosus]|uniref:Uncharacterized protein n=1 Tax=Araneus ventricosus TaxID=182803 RepID=A0A4Y2GT96_ARAVE|nr:hypothetical protein AVEN_211089-1 [Araneus ventricosus]